MNFLFYGSTVKLSVCQCCDYDTRSREFEKTRSNTLDQEKWTRSFKNGILQDQDDLNQKE